MHIVFESKEITTISDSELENVLKCLRRKSYVYIGIVNCFMVIMLALGILMLFNRSPWIFIISIIYFIEMYLISKHNITKFRKTLSKTSNYVFEADYFCVNKKQFTYTDIDTLEVGNGFARIKIGKCKLVVIFKGKEEAELHMLVAKLKANAKQYKEV